MLLHQLGNARQRRRNPRLEQRVCHGLRADARLPSAAPASELYGATDAAVGALWSWSVKRRMLAIVDSTQTLKLIG